MANQSKRSSVGNKRTKFLKKFAWDRIASEEELLIRAMLIGNPLEVCELFAKEELKKIFLRNLHRFKGRDRNFWKIVLNVSDEELNENSALNVREGCFRVPD